MGEEVATASWDPEVLVRAITRLEMARPYQPSTFLQVVNDVRASRPEDTRDWPRLTLMLRLNSAEQDFRNMLLILEHLQWLDDFTRDRPESSVSQVRFMQLAAETFIAQAKEGLDNGVLALREAFRQNGKELKIKSYDGWVNMLDKEPTPHHRRFCIEAKNVRDRITHAGSLLWVFCSSGKLTFCFRDLPDKPSIPNPKATQLLDETVRWPHGSELPDRTWMGDRVGDLRIWMSWLLASFLEELNLMSNGVRSELRLPQWAYANGDFDDLFLGRHTAIRWLRAALDAAGHPTPSP